MGKRQSVAARLTRINENLILALPYKHPRLSTTGLTIDVKNKPLFVPVVSPNHPFYSRINRVFDLEEFTYAAPPLELGIRPINIPKNPVEVY